MNNTFRLFVSSTFSDFIKERSILNKEVFEKVNLLLNKKGYSFQVVDLRWGINTESALNQNTLEICLNDVKYCKKNSPKPNFLIMVGERYGWVPLPSSVKADEFEKILDVCDADQKKLLCKWYLLDRNNVPEIYYLDKRTGEYADEQVWKNEESRLHDILEKKAIECGFEESELVKYTASATEHEILEGLFENENTADNVIVLFREGYSERDEDIFKVKELKRRIKEKIDEDCLSENLITLDYGENYYREMEEKITALLINNILAELRRLETEKKDYFPERLPNEVFCGREAELEALKSYVDGDEKGVYYLSGQSGSGKTTLLKEFVYSCSIYDPQKEFNSESDAAIEKAAFKEAWASLKKYIKSKAYNCFCVFFGEDDVYSIYDCLKKLCLMIISKYNIALNKEINRFNISEIFLNVLNEAPRSVNNLIVIDGLDMFYDIASVNENIFPDTLPESVKIIASCADDNVLEKLKKRNDINYRIEGLSCNEATESFYKMLEVRGRRLFRDEQKNAVAEALSDGANPLSCKLLCDLAAGWRENDDVKPFEFDDYEMAKLHIFDVSENCGHDENIVRYMLSYIATAPYGITEDELLMLLFRHREIREKFEKEDRYGYNLSKLPFAVLTRILYDLRECIHLAKAKESIVVAFNHNVFKNVVLSEFKKECDIAKECLLEYYASLENYISEDKYPNTKKLIPLLKMLRDKQMFDDISVLLSDITFADAMIKAGNLTELCQYCEEAESKGILGERGQALFKCIKDNIITLDCYKNGLEACACDYGFEKVNTLLNIRDTVRLDGGFGSYSKMYWSCDGNQYATVYDNYVYIYKKNSYRNYLSVHINFPNSLNDEKILEVIWTKEDKFAVILNIGKIYVYKIENEMPKFEIKLDCAEDIKNARYSHKYNILLFKKGRSLVAVDMCSYNEMYTIHGAGDGIFDINDTMERIVLLSGRKCMKLFNLCNGTFINDIVIYQSVNESTESIYLLEKGTFIGIEPGYPPDVKLLSSVRKKRLRFPEQYDIKGFVKFKNSFVAYYENMLICAGAETLKLSYLFLPDIRCVHCVGDGVILSVTTKSDVK
ncbi:MAG: DUF4062 domain-containing protein, partial [Clostridia bacterium]|nr:DUF4062 domain-containing protein [Clostridia bacterium]